MFELDVTIESLMFTEDKISTSQCLNETFFEYSMRHVLFESVTFQISLVF